MINNSLKRVMKEIGSARSQIKFKVDSETSKEIGEMFKSLEGWY